MKVAIADDHLLILSSVTTALSSVGYMELCGTYTSGNDLLEGIKSRRPDVLLLDYHLPDQNGAQLALHISYHYPEVKIIALTGYDKPDLATRMLESGCMGYLLKTSADTNTIIEAIESVYAGNMYIDHTIRDNFMKAIHRINNRDQEQNSKLTLREIEILREIASELSNQEIAEKLFISKRTVETHRNRIMTKLGAKNTVGLIKYAIELKLI